MQCWIDSAAVLHSRIRRHSVASCPQVRNLSVQLRSLCRLHRSPFVRNLLHAEASVPSPMGCSLRSLLQDPATRSCYKIVCSAAETSPDTRNRNISLYPPPTIKQFGIAHSIPPPIKQPIPSAVLRYTLRLSATYATVLSSAVRNQERT